VQAQPGWAEGSTARKSFNQCLGNQQTHVAMQLFGVVFEPFNDNAFKLLIAARLCWFTVKRLDIPHPNDDVLHLLKALQVPVQKLV
jgi:hypothetical protein